MASHVVRAVFSLALMGSAADACAGDLLQIAADGHRETLEKIASIEAVLRMEVLAKGQTSAKHDIEWSQQGDRVRWKQRMSGLNLNLDDGTSTKITAREDHLGLGLTTTIVRSAAQAGNEEQREATIDARPLGDVVGYQALWSRAGLMLYDSPQIWFKDALQSTDWRRTAKRVDLEGEPMILIEGQPAKEELPTFLVWIDPAHCYLAKKFIHYVYKGDFDPQKPHALFKVERFSPPYKDTGISFPAVVVMRFFLEGDDVFENRITFASIKINEPIPPDVFRIKIPAGYRVIDRAGGRHYTMGPDGEVLKPAPLLPIPRPPPPSAPSRAWLIYLLLGLLLIGLGWTIYQRRSRSESSAR
jgi:hypothetical protein